MDSDGCMHLDDNQVVGLGSDPDLPLVCRQGTQLTAKEELVALERLPLAEPSPPYLCQSLQNVPSVAWMDAVTGSTSA